jgi:hypothetical protein
MMLFKVLKRLYCYKDSSWIHKLSNEDVAQSPPFLLQRYLLMNPRISKHVRWLDKYTFNLPTKMYLSLAWSVLPKYDITPKVKYIKKKDTSEQYEYIISCFRKELEMSDNDFESCREYLLSEIEKNPVQWFKYYGAPKKLWKDNKLDFNEMKKSDKPEVKKQQGLQSWFS